MRTTHRAVATVTAAFVALLGLPMLGGAAYAAEPVITQDTSVNGCNGVLPTPGSENTTKRLDPAYPSDFNPGGTVGYVIDYPVDPSELGQTFRITDCVFVGDTAVAKYFVDFVPNSTSFQLRFSVPVPAGTALGSQFCNYAKTTAAPSASQASNRKAGPACFTVGGGLRIEKRAGSASGPILPGASFRIVCSPSTAQPDTIISGLSNQSVVNGNGTVTASGVATDGTIAIVGPSGTPCVVTETAAPDGYVLDPTPRTLTIPVGTAQTVNVFVNEQLGSLSVTKQAVGAAGTFRFTVACNDGKTYAPFELTLAAGQTRTHLVSDAIAVGTACTVTEAASPLWQAVRNPANGTVTVDADGATVAFTNTRRTGDLVVHKTADQDGTFVFDVDCTGTEHDTTLTVTTTGGTGVARVTGIPTTLTCTVTERPNALFSSFVEPAGGVVVVVAGDNDVWFTNSRLRGDLVIGKTADENGTFTFDIDCSDDAYDRSDLSITTNAGRGSVTVAGIPTGVVCTVTEDSSPHWTSTVVPSDGRVTIAVGDNGVAFTNVRNRGNLVIAKASDVDGTFTFDVDCTDDAYDRPNVTVTTSEGAGTVTVEGIPTGVVCTVTEDADPRWTHTVTPGDGTVTIAAGANRVAFTNTRVRGALLVTKATNEDGTFVFDVDCTGTEHDVHSLKITTVNGTGSATIDGIPTGTVCTVLEVSDGRFTTTVVPADGTVTVGAGGATVAFTNIRRTGSLIVSKAILDDSASGPYDFEFSLRCGDVLSMPIHLGTAPGLSLVQRVDGIPTGTECTVRELTEPGWTVQVVPDDGTVTITDVPATVDFTNTRLFADVSLSKTSVPAPGTPVRSGDTIRYGLPYTNLGSVPATVTITDVVPTGTTLVPGSAGDAVLTGRTLSWTVTVPGGGAGSVGFAVTVDEGLPIPMTISNVALLHQGDDPPISTNEVTHPVPALSIVKSVDRAEAEVGDRLTYTLGVSNVGSADLTGVVVTDPLPEGTTFVSAGQGGSCNTPCTEIRWPAVDLASNATLERTFVVTIDEPPGFAEQVAQQADIFNTAAVRANEVPKTLSNEVMTRVSVVFPIVCRTLPCGPNPPPGPPILPVNGVPTPIPHTVALALGLLLGGAGLQYAGDWRARLRK